MNHDWTVETLAYYIWKFLKETLGELSSMENHLLAEGILVRGNRPTWLFKLPGFEPFTTI